MKRRLLLVHLFHIMVYVGHVVVLFELLDEFLDRLAPFGIELLGVGRQVDRLDRKSTRLNSSHAR